MTNEIEVFPTKDEKIIKEIISSPDVWDGSRDDSCPEKPHQLDISSKINDFLFLCVSVNSMACGLFMFEIESPKVYFVHTMMTAKCRGAMAIRAGKRAIKWIFDNTGCRKIKSYCFSDSPATLLFARLCGFKTSDRSTHDSTRKGKIVDIINCFLDNPLIET